MGLTQLQGRLLVLKSSLSFGLIDNLKSQQHGSGIDRSHLELERTDRSSTRIIAYLFG
jgi:hypothetical protein